MPQYYSGAGTTVAKKPEQECVADGPIQTLQNEYERIFGQSNSYEAKNERTVINYNSLQTTDLQVAKRELEKAFAKRRKDEIRTMEKEVSNFLIQCKWLEVRETRLDQLINFSNATYLDSITESFSEIRCLFEENARVIMHYLIVDGYADTDAKVNIQLADRHEREVEEMVADNNDVIKSVDALLDKAAQLVNKFNSEESKKPRTEDILVSLDKQTELLERMSTKGFRLDE
ncbi:MAG: hypothetical protein Q4F60_00590 [Candidatus Saccharibacteria bacterium]|nr:hypothetical protein [Candidatus Saccharibacteria bacterium]